MIKIGAVVVTYNPRISDLRSNLDALKNQVKKVIVVDNGSLNVSSIQEVIKAYSSMEIIKLNTNFGIAKAQNIAFDQFDTEGFEWVLTIDQDTILPKDYVYQLNSGTELDNVGIITGAFIDVNWNQKQLTLVRNSRNNKIQSINEEISSGNIVSVRAWKDVKGFDEFLFIDYVDFDFDYKLKENNYSIYRFNKVEFFHEIGSSIENSLLTKILLLDKKRLFDHSPQRLYFINRNRIIVRKRYPKFGSPRRMVIREILNLREILVMSSPRILKLKKSLSGILSGIWYK